ncbi:MAG: 1-(5-phosphoribosyl)-5-[(5-phosphoribosylamino)methylideneamino]imidazole-4-carboxamide isomerase [Candidatus Hodarchaeota archaeon]
MEIIPAIDISKGKCVRLYQGLKGTEKIYYEDPLEALEFWINKGAKKIHIIDLDGAWGSDVNRILFKNLIKNASNKINIQVGGGIRDIESAFELIKIGADRIILGTIAIEDPKLVKNLVKKIGPNKIIVAIDYHGERIAIQGWTKLSIKNPFSFVKKIENLGVRIILFSSIKADGTLSGPDFQNIQKMINTVKKASIYVAGGIRDIDDIDKLRQMGVRGVIIGKAFYEQTIPFSIIKNSKYDDENIFKED